MQFGHETVRSTYAQLREWLTGRWPEVTELPHQPEDPDFEHGLFLPGIGASSCVIRIGTTRDSTVRVNLYSPIRSHIVATPELFGVIGQATANWTLGTLGMQESSEPDRHHLVFDYSIPAVALTPAVLDHLIRTVVAAAGDMAARQFGVPNTPIPAPPLPLPSESADVTFTKARDWLIGRWPELLADPANRSFFLPDVGSNSCAVMVDHRGPDEPVLVRLYSVAQFDADTSPDVYEAIGRRAANWYFGNLGIYPGQEPGTHDLVFLYSVPAAALSAPVLGHLVDVVATAAAEMGARLA